MAQALTLDTQTEASNPSDGVLERRRATPRQTLFFEGDERSWVYQIVSGWVKLYRTLIDGQRQVVGFARAGEVIGLEGTQAYLCSAEAITDVELKRFPARRLSAMCARDGTFAATIVEQLGRQLAAAHGQLAAVGAKNADQRIAGFLLSLAEDDEVDLPMRRGDVAEFLGLRLETISRKFSEFQRRGWMEMTSLYHVRLRRADVLADLAEGGEAPAERAA